MSRPDFTPELTPVEERGAFWVKREDAWIRGGAIGAKARAMFRLAEERASPGILSAGQRRSPQLERAALVAQALGIPARLHVPASKQETPELACCAAAGAQLLRHPAGRLSVIRARFRADAEAHPDWLCVPYGMTLEEYVADMAPQAANLPADTARIVTACGSGISVAGILRGLELAGRERLPVVAVCVGMDPTPTLDRFAPGWRRRRLALIPAALPFEKRPERIELDGLTLDPFFEAKALPYMTPGDLLWTVGIRTAPLA